MIRLKTIHIEEFRGIRNLDLDLGGKNFGICGPNGTGKSGVVDAIEFCLTGKVTRLSGEGQGELSVARHAPHVDSRTQPENAKVEITAVIPFLGKDVTIARSVNMPNQVRVTPAGGREEVIVRSLRAHPETALSRREIAKYIITPPLKRSTDVQNLLRLDQIGNLRKALNSYNNKCRRDSEEAERIKRKAEHELKTAVGGIELSRELVLNKANENRKVLGLPDLTELTPETIFNETVESGEDSRKYPALAKVVALADLSAFAEAAAKDEPQQLAVERTNALASLNTLREDSAALMLARQHSFITAGLEFVTEDACPLCDAEWPADALRAHLNKKLLSIDAIGKVKEALEASFVAIGNAIKDRLADIRKVAGYGKTLDPAIPTDGLDGYVIRLEGIQKSTKDFCEDHTKIDPAISAVRDDWWSLPEEVQTCLEEIKKTVEGLPDTSEQDKAIAFLAELKVRYDSLIEVTEKAKAFIKRSTVGQKIYDQYNTISNSILESIYDDVAKEFTELYKAINDDEGKFVGELKAAPAKLSFNVDFYGRGQFPPGAYHSEGHQDGMGLCLYLALMQQTLGDKFTFSVLDDVLMSVDTGHRREVCRLLKTRFPNTQFILTTHDRVWLQYMKTEKLIEKSQVFAGWSVDFGPRVWDDKDVWEEIQEQLDKNDVPRAAWLLRRYLEYIATVLAENLRAQVEFRGDGSYDLGDLLPPVLTQWQSRLEKGIKVANYWSNEAEKTALISKRDEAKNLVSATYVEQWAINPSVHFNEWENFGSDEFQKVVASYRALLDHMRCSNQKCGSLPYLTPRKGSAEQLRCNCQGININLNPHFSRGGGASGSLTV